MPRHEGGTVGPAGAGGGLPGAGTPGPLGPGGAGDAPGSVDGPRRPRRRPVAGPAAGLVGEGGPGMCQPVAAGAGRRVDRDESGWLPAASRVGRPGRRRARGPGGAGPLRAGRRCGRPRRRRLREGARAVAGPAAGRAGGVAAGPAGGGPADRAAPGRAGGAARRDAGGRTAPRGGGRGPGPGARTAVARESVDHAGAGAVPLRAAGRRPRLDPLGPPDPRPAARARPGIGAGGSRARDPRAVPGPRHEPRGPRRQRGLPLARPGVVRRGGRGHLLRPRGRRGRLSGSPRRVAAPRAGGPVRERQVVPDEGRPGPCTASSRDARRPSARPVPMPEGRSRRPGPAAPSPTPCSVSTRQRKPSRQATRTTCSCGCEHWTIT